MSEEPETTQPAEHQSANQTEQQAGEPDPLKEWTLFGTLLFAVAGVGVGLYYFVLDAVDEEIFSPDGDVGGLDGLDAGVDLAFSTLFIFMVAMMAIFVATFVGVALTRVLPLEDDVVLKIAGAVGAVGTLAAFLIMSIFTLLVLDNVSLEVGGLLINGVVSAVFGGVTGAGGAWTVQNQTPEIP